ncbi:hypothetical protein JRO89_XS08G0227500 [Xanthoceras sorbifolium]|uniref:Uncharacterized protein n=1 Tax=Xanthoceras sorbifolium TaxID=99658 RepID=A0ABQ8HQX4_9ROSI|nr:hypothetical protein JRO89_XS08G0227500 [Xanthoceras sorbifolium]
MAMAMVRSGLLRTALRGGSRTSSAPPKRGFASSGHHDDACKLLLRGLIEFISDLNQYETAKWEKISYLGIAACTVLAIYTLSKGHPHYDEPPAYPYLHIRNKEFPWGPDGLFEKKQH